MEKAVLLLEDGTAMEGQALGARGTAIGTVVFNTSMVGYQELLTSPANRGLLLAQTFPLAGNYGINDQGWESGRVQAAGYIVRECCALPSNYQCKGTLEDFLRENGVTGICGIDTRHLTKLIREKGEMRAAVSSDGGPRDALLARIREYREESGIPAVSRKEAVLSGKGESLCNIGVLDLGAPESMLRILLSHGCRVRLLPWDTSAGQIKALAEAGEISGLVLSDGPGSPEAEPSLIGNVRGIFSLGLPLLGVSLGHQVLALAAGMKVKRLPCGHRGANQPVVYLETGRTYITSQNHAYTVEADGSLCETVFVNANDKTCEGLRYKGKNASSVQFLPDGEAHTHSTAFVYEQFLASLGGENRKGGM